MLRPILIVLLVTLTKGIFEQSSSPKLTRNRSLNANTPSTSWRSRLGNTKSFTAAPQLQRSQSISGTDLTESFPLEFNEHSMLGRASDYPQWGPQVPDMNPDAMMIALDPNGNPLNPLPPGYSIDTNSIGLMDIDEFLAKERRREEEEDPDSHKINTEGEIIEQQLPIGGGNIVIKISGTNITQRKMKKLREFMKKSIDFVFNNTQNKTSIKARFV